MSWSIEDTRQVYKSGKLIVGAIYPPTRAGLRWRWSIWVTGRRKPTEGKADNQGMARHLVEIQFREFLTHAGLTKAEGGDA